MICVLDSELYKADLLTDEPKKRKSKRVVRAQFKISTESEKCGKEVIGRTRGGRDPH